MKRQLIVITIVGFGILSFFQNCGQPMSFVPDGFLTKVDIGDTQTSGASGSTTNTNSSTTSNTQDLSASTDNGTSAATDNGSSGSSGSTDSVDTSTTTDMPSSGTSTTTTDAATGNSMEGQDDSAMDNDDDDLEYICILQESGKAVGFMNGSLDTQSSNPQLVCMSQNACQNIISKKFEVKEAAYHDDCDHQNPNVVPLSDSQIEALIN